MFFYNLGIGLGTFAMASVLIVIFFNKIKYTLKKISLRIRYLKTRKALIKIFKKWARNNKSKILYNKYFQLNSTKIPLDVFIVNNNFLIIVKIFISNSGDIKIDFKESKWEKIENDKIFYFTNPKNELDSINKRINLITNNQIPIVNLIVFNDKIRNLKVENNDNPELIVTKKRKVESILFNLKNHYLVSKLDKKAKKTLYKKIKQKTIKRKMKWN